MSSIVTLETPDSTFQSTIVGSQLEIVAQQGEENIIEVKGDSPITIFGGSLSDEITTGAGDAVIFGGDGDDSIKTGIGDDIIVGGEGDDIISSGIGADFIFGGAGNDTIRGGLPGIDSDGNPIGDILQGGAGDDVFEFAANEFESGATDKIVDFQADGFADIIRVFGVSDGDVSYDADTGMVSINGKPAIDVGTGLDIEASQKGDSDTWELF
ncbi:MAG: calcium-binding protein [Pleurocapsa sp.]